MMAGGKVVSETGGGLVVGFDGTVCALNDDEVVKRTESWWFSELGLLADVGGRLWVRPR